MTATPVSAPADAPEWSAVVIARNEEATIGRCLESVFHALAGRAFDVIVVDSASTDRTVEIAERYPARIVRLPARGPLRPALGRHAGWQRARGRWILFVDGDAILDPLWIEPAMRALEADPLLAGVSGSGEGVMPRADGTVETCDQYPRVEYDAPRHLSGSALYRRAALEHAGGFNPSLYACEEIELGARLLKHGYRLRRLRVRMTQHFPKARRESVSELLRRTRRCYPIGMGQLARHAITYRLPVDRPFGRIGRQLWFAGLLAAGTVSLLAAIALRREYPALIWAAGVAVIFGLFALRTRSVLRPAYYFLEWSLTCPMVVYGLLARPRPITAFRIGDESAGGLESPRMSATNRRPAPSASCE